MAFLYCLSKRKNRPAATKPDDPSSPSSFPLPFLPFLRLARTHALLALSFRSFACPAPLLLLPLRTGVASLWGFLLIQVHRSLSTRSFSLQYCTCCCTFVFCWHGCQRLLFAVPSIALLLLLLLLLLLVLVLVRRGWWELMASCRDISPFDSR